MEELMQFLKENPAFYFATVEGYLPRVRPFGFAMEYNGRLYFAIGKHKAAYKQILDNTNIEVCTANSKGEWIRIRGTVDFDNSPEVKEKAFAHMPQLKELYAPETGKKLAMVYMDRISARLFSMDGTEKELYRQGM